MNLDGINWLAVLAAAASAFLLGGLWYGPLFRNAWCRENGMDPDTPPKRHPGKVFGTAFVAALVAAIAFAVYLGQAPSLLVAVHAGFVIGLAYGTVAGLAGRTALFVTRSYFSLTSRIPALRRKFLRELETHRAPDLSES